MLCGLFRLTSEFLYFELKLLDHLLRPFGAYCRMLACIRLDLCPIDRHAAYLFQIAKFLG